MLTTQTFKEFDMSFQNLNKDELTDVVEFFVVDVEAADPEKGPTKKELLAALASGDDPVTWEDYNDTYLPAKAAGTDKSREEKLEQARLEAEAKADAAAAEKDADKAEEKVEEAPEADDEEEVEEKVEAEADAKSGYVLVKMERKNPSYETSGFRFTKQHPFASVPPVVAKYLVQNVKGFRLALPDELTDYYN